MLGGTGAVGSALVRELLAGPRWASVSIFVRAPTTQFTGVPGASRLSEHVIDLAQLERDVAGELTMRRDAQLGTLAAFCTLGIGQPSRVSAAEHRRVDVGIAGAFARACRAADVPHFCLLTAVGADASSWSRYVAVKGEIEDVVRALGFRRTSLFRPSLLVTRDIRYGLQDRVMQALFPRVSPVLPSRYHEITVSALGRAMRLDAERDGVEGTEILEYAAFERLLAE